MTYRRFVGRNYLEGDYGNVPSQPVSLSMAAGDMRRLEKDALDDNYGQRIADVAGVSLDVSRKVLLAFFNSGHSNCNYGRPAVDNMLPITVSI